VDGLRDLGWDAAWEAAFAPHGRCGLTPGRVVRADRGSELVATGRTVLRARPATRLMRTAGGAPDLPAVGDWVAVRTGDLDVALIDAVLPRRGAITRGAPGGVSGVQVLAANVDAVLVVHPTAAAPNTRRIERELVLAWESGATPVVVLTKTDRCPDPAAVRAAVAAVAPGVEIVQVDARDPGCAAMLAGHVAGGRTAVLIGPSGAGKSTLANALCGEDRQAVGAVREHDLRGRHTTVARELIVLPGGGILIDTPGLRELGMTGADDEGIDAVFPDVEALAARCRFRDCTHRDEPGCAVRAAVDDGTLPPERLDAFLTLVRESAAAAERADARLAKHRGREISRAVRQHKRLHPR
jgi:ribosome biogenesis GTPase